MKKHIAIAGSGFAGAVLARKLAESEQFRVTLYEERRQVGGICHTHRDDETNIMIHDFGPKIFHTNNESIWNYINKWGKFERLDFQMKAKYSKGIFTLPINLQTINHFFGKSFSPQVARDFMGSLVDSTLTDPKNLEEMALSQVGSEIYRDLFYEYAKKRWGMEPSNIMSHQCQGLTVRFNYLENFYADEFQGVPLSGFTEIIRRILDHQDITLRLGQKLEPQMKDQFDHVFWSGPMDGFYHYQAGRLGYRTLKFERFIENGDYQGTAVINYCDHDAPFTRIIEHKHLTPWENHDKTVCFKEYSMPCGESDMPIIPTLQRNDQEIHTKYLEMIQKENKLTFIGRLGTYRHLEIDQMIAESLQLAEFCITNDMKNWPKINAAC